jgi:OmpA-OmpF porin, OOP family
MRCNWLRWLWGIIPLLVLSWVAVQALHGPMERELAERSRLALIGAGFPWGVAEFQGRDALLTGRAPQEGEPDKAAGIVSALWGVRVVDNRAGLLDKTETFVWAASRRNNRVRLTGFAPSMTAKQAILGVAKASFPGFEIVDRTTLARGAPSPDVWMAAASFALRQLTSIKRGDASLKNLELHFAGEAEDIAGYRAIKQALSASVPKGLKVVSDLVRPPVVSPFTWSAQMNGSRLVLSGYVPNEGARRDLLAAARERSPGISIVDRMEPGDGEPQGWLEAVATCLRELARLEGGSAETKDAVLSVSGLAGDASVAEGIRSKLRTVAATIKFNDNIRVKEPPPPPTPPSPQPTAPTPEKEPDAASRTQPAPPPPQTAATPSPPPEIVVKARVCEDKLTDLARSGQILFRVSSAELDHASFPTLDRLADAAKTCPGMHIEVSGHASSEGDPDHNQMLSQQRAQSVVGYLVRAGVSASQLEAVGFGATRPIAPNDTNENMAKNRRIEFAVRPQ